MYGIDKLKLKKTENNVIKYSEVWRNCTVGREPKGIFDQNYIHDTNNTSNTFEYNLLHNILNRSKHVKSTNYHYYPIIHGHIKVCKVKSE